MKSLPFNPLKDLQPVGLTAVGQTVIVTGSRVAMPTLASLVEHARSRTIFYGTAGVGTTSHLAAELLNDVAGIRMTAVHYRGATNAMIDMAGGRLDVVRRCRRVADVERRQQDGRARRRRGPDERPCTPGHRDRGLGGLPGSRSRRLVGCVCTRRHAEHDGCPDQ